jgi:elongator complex protein 3
MPKSYLASEPGAQRAENNFFDPYLQTYNRIETLHDMGHPVDKIELIVLGGTWSSYPESYQRWFITQCFRAMNHFQNDEQDERAGIRAFYRQIQAQIKQLGLPALTDNRQQNEQIFSSYQISGERPEQNYNQLISQLFLQPEQRLGLAQKQTASWQQLEQAQQTNETSRSRCVGLVLETRPDQVDAREVRRLRRLGCTKVQIGLQSLQDSVLQKNKRGHDVERSAQALRLLRLTGFKIHAHWMPNLYGSDVAADKQDYSRLFNDERFKPDELKIYPCSLLESAELMQYYQRGQWQPYNQDELLEVLSFCLTHTPPYCRLTRVVRDIPSFDIVEGNKKTNFRQIVQQHLSATGQTSQNIRAREIRDQAFAPDQVQFEQLTYQTSVSQEYFLQYTVEVVKEKVDNEISTKHFNQTGQAGLGADSGSSICESRQAINRHKKQTEQKLLGFLRLSLPKPEAQAQFIDQSGLKVLQSAAMIREIHVYGQMVSLGQQANGAGGKAQHLGLGTKLIKKARTISREQGYQRLAVISAIGTKQYYRQRGFKDQGLYQVCVL